MTKNDETKQENHTKIIDLFRNNPTKLYSITDLKENLSLAFPTLKKHLKFLINDGIVKEVISKSTYHVFQYNQESESVINTNKSQ